MKKELNKRAGFTFIEVLVTSALVSLVLVSVMNLLGRVYSDISTAMLKNNSVTLASEKLDHYRQFAFNSSGLQITDDRFLPMPYSRLKTAPAGHYEKTTYNNMDYEIYSWVQWAAEEDGSIAGKKQAELGYDFDYNMKKISVAVVYNTAAGFEKVSKMSTFISNRDLPVSGSTITGKILRNDGGTVKGAGLSTGAYVLLRDFPQYMTRIYDENGNYRITNVAPGAYQISARGAGLVSSNYGSNPLVIQAVPTVYANINITCSSVATGKIKGNVYWGVAEGTGTPTPTPVAYCPKSRVLYATGEMSSMPTPQWQTFTKISAYDGTADSLCDPCNSDTRTNVLSQRGYSEFSDAAGMPSGGICEVILKIKVDCWACWASIGFNFTKDSGATWANTGTNTWSGGVATPVVTYSIPNIYLDAEAAIPITHLYSQWDWNKVNSLGVLINGPLTLTKDPSFPHINNYLSLDYVRIDVLYYEGPPPPTFTPTPAVTATPAAFPCAYNAVVQSLDRLSNPARTSYSDCKYEIISVDVSSSTLTAVTAFKERASDGTSYFKRIDNVQVSAGSTTTLDIFLEPASNTPAVFGVVRDASTNAPVAGALVSLNDANGNSAVTSGGGSYLIMPATEGTYTLSAKMPGYKSANPLKKYWYKGINKAEDLLLQPVGSISGSINDETTGDPLANTSVNVKDSSGNVVATGKTGSTGQYVIEGIYAGQSYRLEAQTDENFEKVVLPAAGHYTAVPVSIGVTTPNRNFRIKKTAGTISGKVEVGGSGAGMPVFAYPSSMPTPMRAHEYKTNNANPNAKKHEDKAKADSPYYSAVADQNGRFTLSVPAGDTYELFAYYSYVSYAGNSKNPKKNLKKFFKKRSSVAVNSENQDITGNIGTWTEY